MYNTRVFHHPIYFSQLLIYIRDAFYNITPLLVFLRGGLLMCGMLTCITTRPINMIKSLVKRFQDQMLLLLDACVYLYPATAL